MTARSRPAFSLFQLLVLLAILAFLFALLFPAIAKVRGAAGRSQSQNNLKQIGLACHNYADVHGKFCPGNDANNFSAAAKLLPYIEQDNLFKLIDFNKPSTDEANKAVRATLIKTFISPLDPQPTVEDGVGPTNYLFSAGSKYPLKDNDGVFFQDSAVRFADIADGTSNTLMAAETLKGDGARKATDVKRQHVLLGKDALQNLSAESGVQEFKDDKNIVGDRCASWMDGRFLQGTFTATRAINDAKPDVSCGGAGGLSGLRTMQTTCNVLLCDGSTRAVSPSVEFETLQKLATRSGAEIIPDF